MKPYLLFLGILLFSEHTAFSNTDTSKFAQNVLLIEAGGAAGYGSLNYERLIATYPDQIILLRMGVGTFRMVDFTRKFNPDFLIPLSINFLFGRAHQLELGFGRTLSSIVSADPSGSGPVRKMDLHAHFQIGYRYQQKTGGFVFRCSYTPLIESYRNFRHWAGISVGYAF